MVTATMICEVCVDGVTGAGAAQTGGAHRLELCQALSVGGISPSAGMIQLVKGSVDLPVHVLIRPRPGNFHFDAAEFAVMRRDIELGGGGRRHRESTRPMRVIWCVKPGCGKYTSRCGEKWWWRRPVGRKV
ncbi:MAG TPA: hypothetical protein DIC52_20665 [Candidatus Latescibacteria bacterium]|nr:hypothetical protein [Candidatus Latescibacterota bacterium]